MHLCDLDGRSTLIVLAFGELVKGFRPHDSDSWDAFSILPWLQQVELEDAPRKTAAQAGRRPLP